MTDNRTRTVADVRHAFTKHGGNLGTDGSVAFLFKHCGQVRIRARPVRGQGDGGGAGGRRRRRGRHEDGSIEVISAPVDFVKVRDGLEKAGLKPEVARSS